MHRNVAKDPGIYVLTSSPARGSARAEGECLEIAAPDAYYNLVYETARTRLGVIR